MSPAEDDFPVAAEASRQDAELVSLYLREGVPVDALAYTEAFDRIFIAMQKLGDTRSKTDVFRRLLNMRKTGRLPRLDLGKAG